MVTVDVMKKAPVPNSILNCAPCPIPPGGNGFGADVTQITPKTSFRTAVAVVSL